MTTGPCSSLFVGLGAMGAPVAEQLAAAEHRLHLHDSDPERARSAAERTGGTRVDDLADPPPTDVVVLMLPDSAAVEAVLLGSGDRPGLLRRTTADLVVDMSSAQPTSTVALAEQAREHGVELVDAPVSGGVARARTGDLSIMFGGSDEALRRLRPLLDAAGSSTVHTGPVGSAHAMKALNNLLSAIGLVGASEVLSVGARFGLDPATMLDVLNRSTGRNHATEVKLARHVLSRAFDSGFPLRLLVKDLRTALDLAEDTAVGAPLAAACLQECLRARTGLGPDADHTELARHVERAAGTELSDGAR